MLRSAQTTSEEKLGREKAAAAAAAEAAAAEWSRWKAPKTCLGPRWIPTTTGEAHEQELMIFAAVEYDAGASLHAASQPASHVSAHSFKG
jgi:cytosine/adenosine deaminase-related metal-dependent hydrolase